MLSYNSRVCGYPEAKPRENRKRGSYAERLTHALAIVYLTYTTQACAVFERVATRRNKRCGLCLYLIHTFGPIACIKSDVRWYKYIYIYMYIRIAFSIELRLRVSRSLRSLANYIATEKYHSSVTGIALVPAALAQIYCN